MKDKTKLIVLSLCMLFLGYISVHSVMGYLTDMDMKNNQIQIGYNDSKIIEDFPTQTLLPSTSITKKVSVKNTGPVDCFVRVFVGLSDENLESNNTIKLDYNTKEWTKSGNWWYYNRSIKPGESTANLITQVTADASYNKEAFDIIVYEESAQSKNASTNKNYSSPVDSFMAID